MELLLTVEQTAARLNLKPVTIQRQLKRGVLRGIKRGRQWRVPESALLEAPASEIVPDSAMEDTRVIASREILDGLHSADSRIRNAAIVALAKADSAVQQMVEEVIVTELERNTEEETDDFRPTGVEWIANRSSMMKVRTREGKRRERFHQAQARRNLACRFRADCW